MNKASAKKISFIFSLLTFFGIVFTIVTIAKMTQGFVESSGFDEEDDLF